MQAARARKERARQEKLAAEEAEREEVRQCVHLCSSMRRATSASVIQSWIVENMVLLQPWKPPAAEIFAAQLSNSAGCTRSKAAVTAHQMYCYTEQPQEAIHCKLASKQRLLFVSHTCRLTSRRPW
jgi:hypothetical protein